VGNTGSYRSAHNSCPVHPHTRGEHFPMIYPLPNAAGSSPHTWGTLITRHIPVHDYRFIPTHVGNTYIGPYWWTKFSVHPHTRGEHFLNSSSAAMNAGSSPHTWGTQPRVRSLQRWGRFIPTHVGNTECAPENLDLLPVHPHTRGEHGLPAWFQYHLAGSSPHTWGTPWHQSRLLFRVPVHPHTRGEHHDHRHLGK